MSIPQSHLESVVKTLRGRSGHPVGPRPSQADEDLMKLLADHVTNEDEALEAWTMLAAEAPEPHVRYIAALIVEDERAHHLLLSEMLDRVRADIDWQTTEPAVPWIRTPKDRGALIGAIDRLLRIERSDLRRLRILRRQLRAQRPTSLLRALADVLEADTRKHVRLLRFLRHTARA